jgi:hypothetical protein
MFVIPRDQIVQLKFQIATLMLRLQPDASYLLADMPDRLGNGTTFIPRGRLAETAALCLQFLLDVV